MWSWLGYGTQSDVSQISEDLVHNVSVVFELKCYSLDVLDNLDLLVRTGELIKVTCSSDVTVQALKQQILELKHKFQQVQIYRCIDFISYSDEGMKIFDEIEYGPVVKLSYLLAYSKKTELDPSPIVQLHKLVLENHLVDVLSTSPRKALIDNIRQDIDSNSNIKLLLLHDEIELLVLKIYCIHVQDIQHAREEKLDEVKYYSQLLTHQIDLLKHYFVVKKVFFDSHSSLFLEKYRNSQDISIEGFTYQSKEIENFNIEENINYHIRLLCGIARKIESLSPTNVESLFDITTPPYVPPCDMITINNNNNNNSEKIETDSIISINNLSTETPIESVQVSKEVKTIYLVSDKKFSQKGAQILSQFLTKTFPSMKSERIDYFNLIIEGFKKETLDEDIKLLEELITTFNFETGKIEDFTPLLVGRFPSVDTSELTCLISIHNNTKEGIEPKVMSLPVLIKIIEIKRKYIEETKYFETIEEFQFTLDGVTMEDNTTLQEVNVGNECKISCSLVNQKESNESFSSIKFSTLEGRTLQFEIPTHESTTMSDIKTEISHRLQVSPSNQVFMYKNRSLIDSNINDSTLVFGLFTKEAYLIGYTKGTPFDLLKLLTLIQDPDFDYTTLKEFETWVFFGCSGSGKTTATYRFLGKMLVRDRIEKAMEGFHTLQEIKVIRLKNSEDTIEGLEIGHEAQSQTSKFKTYLFPEKDNIKVADTPGFFDNRGHEIVISNSILLTKCLRCCKSVKPIIFLSTEQFVTVRGDALRSICSYLGNIFVNLFQHCSKLTFFITRNKKKDYGKACTILYSSMMNVMHSSEVNLEPPGKAFLQWITSLLDDTIKLYKEKKVINPQIIFFDPVEDKKNTSIPSTFTEIVKYIEDKEPIYPKNEFNFVVPERSLELLMTELNRMKIEISDDLKAKKYHPISQYLELVSIIKETLEHPEIIEMYQVSEREILQHIETLFNDALKYFESGFIEANTTSQITADNLCKTIQTIENIEQILFSQDKKIVWSFDPHQFSLVILLDNFKQRATEKWSNMFDYVYETILVEYRNLLVLCNLIPNFKLDTLIEVIITNINSHIETQLIKPITENLTNGYYDATDSCLTKFKSATILDRVFSPKLTENYTYPTIDVERKYDESVSQVSEHIISRKDNILELLMKYKENQVLVEKQLLLIKYAISSLNNHLPFTKMTTEYDQLVKKVNIEKLALEENFSKLYTLQSEGDKDAINRIAELQIDYFKNIKSIQDSLVIRKFDNLTSLIIWAQKFSQAIKTEEVNDSYNLLITSLSQTAEVICKDIEETINEQYLNLWKFISELSSYDINFPQFVERVMKALKSHVESYIKEISLPLESQTQELINKLQYLKLNSSSYLLIQHYLKTSGDGLHITYESALKIVEENVKLAGEKVYNSLMANNQDEVKTILTLIQKLDSEDMITNYRIDIIPNIEKYYTDMLSKGKEQWNKNNYSNFIIILSQVNLTTKIIQPMFSDYSNIISIMSECVATLISHVKESLLNEVNPLNLSTDSVKIANSLIEIKKKYIEIPSLKPDIDSAFSQLLTHLQSTDKSYNLICLIGEHLNSNLSPIGKEILNEHSQFRRALSEPGIDGEGIEHNLNDYIQRVSTKNDLDSTSESLNKCYQTFSATFYKEKIVGEDELKKSSTPLIKILESMVDRAITLKKDIIQKSKGNFLGYSLNWQEHSENFLSLIGIIYAAWSLSSPYTSSDSKKFPTPNYNQVLSIIKLLMLDIPDTKSIGIRSHLCQMKNSGENSLPIAIVSTLLAFLGNSVDCVSNNTFTYTKNRKTYLPLFKLFKVETFIRYCKLEDLCDSVLNTNGCQNIMKNFVQKGQLGGRKEADIFSYSSHILIVDEFFDVFDENFLKGISRPMIKITDSLIHKFVKYIWSHRDLFDITKEKEYKDIKRDLLLSYQNFDEIIKGEVDKMLAAMKSVHSSLQSSLSSSKDELTSYETMFKKFKLFPNSDLDSFISICCGHFSNAKIPSHFGSILGYCTTYPIPSQIDAIDNLFQVKLITQTPPLYEYDIPNQTIEIINEESGWCLAIQKRIGKAYQSKSSTIVVFEDKERLDSFKNKFGIMKLSHCQEITDNNSYDEIEVKIQNASKLQQVTLITSKLGKNLNFNFPRNSNVEIILTYLPGSENEESQIKEIISQTGTQSTFTRFFCKSHLKTSLLSIKDELITVDNIASLENLRNENFKSSFSTLIQIVENTGYYHKISKDCINGILTGNSKDEEKKLELVRKLTELNRNSTDVNNIPQNNNNK